MSVDSSKFRTCSQTSFCRAYRYPSSIQSLDPPTVYSTVSIPVSSIDTTALHTKGLIAFQLHYDKKSVDYQGQLHFLLYGGIRIHITGINETRYEEKESLHEEGLMPFLGARIMSKEEIQQQRNVGMEEINRIIGIRAQENIQLYLTMQPFQILIYDGETLMSSINRHGLFHYEKYQLAKTTELEDTQTKEAEQQPTETERTDPIDPHNGKKIVDYGEDGLAIYEDGTVEERKIAEEIPVQPAEGVTTTEESFGGHVDSRPLGPSSVGLDINFYGMANSHYVYGIPEHASSFALKNTRPNSWNANSYNEPFRLYNLDVFEYELDKPMALYGSIPVLISHNSNATMGLYWHNPTETFIDIETLYYRPAENNQAMLSSECIDEGQQPHSNDRQEISTHWISESSTIDFVILTGRLKDVPAIGLREAVVDANVNSNAASSVCVADTSYSPSIYYQYHMLTGFSPLPPLFSLAYHQCRWNYKSQEDVEYVNREFEKSVIPYDVLWLDIEHTDGKRYFTWDTTLFPDPIKMQQDLEYYGRYMVTIIDPHIKRDDNYYIHKEATANHLYIQDKTGTRDYEGWCWPGSSSYLDFTTSKVREFWREQFMYEKYKSSTPTLYTWNDMNEPSVFNGPEVTMSKDLKNLQGIEHRQWHNLYGKYLHQASFEGQLYRQVKSHELVEKITEKLNRRRNISQCLEDKADMKSDGSKGTIRDMLTSVFSSSKSKVSLSSVNRSFVLSRSFFAGSQSYGAIWTGDNMANWEQLEISVPMLLSMNIVGLTFVGADVGGFFKNPTEELLVRWYQLGVYYPFFRAHAHHDSKRREPYLFANETFRCIKSAIQERYQLLPYIYTTFYENTKYGIPITRPLLYEFPKDTKTFALQKEFLFGSNLLVYPVTKPSLETVEVYLPSELPSQTDTVWYNLHDNSLKRYAGGASYTFPITLDFIPVFLRGGSILMKKMRLRRSSKLMHHDPYTMVVGLGPTGEEASGYVYMDDEQTIDYAMTKEYVYASLKFITQINSSGKRESTLLCAKLERKKVTAISKRYVERIEILGVEQSPSHVILLIENDSMKDLEFKYEVELKRLTVKKPLIDLTTSGWKVQVVY